MTTQPTRANRQYLPHWEANRPEAEFSPFPAGISIALRVNDVQTNGGPRPMQSITVSPGDTATPSPANGSTHRRTGQATSPPSFSA